MSEARDYSEPGTLPVDSSGRPKADAQLTALVEAYASLIRSAVRRVSGPRAALIQDDVQQNVMLALWRQLERGQTIERPASYIFRAAIRETVRLLRRDHAHAPAASEHDQRVVEAAAASDPQRDLEERERQKGLMDCLATLEARRQLAVRAHLSGFTVAEIMEMFDWPYQRARHLVARGMADLRRALRERGIHE
jgi:RNA polymerase sigma factor (sigma-70 family)